jgi:hypothetical protein
VCGIEAEKRPVLPAVPSEPAGANAWQQWPNVKRLLDAVNTRAAAQRVEVLKERHAFETEMDDKARRAMFPQNERVKSPGAWPRRSPAALGNGKIHWHGSCPSRASISLAG